MEKKEPYTVIGTLRHLNSKQYIWGQLCVDVIIRDKMLYFNLATGGQTNPAGRWFSGSFGVSVLEMSNMSNM